MVEDQVGLRKDHVPTWAPWTKLFTGFKVALDPKKLLLAAAGIVLMSLGWWVLSWVFYSARPQPTWPGDYLNQYSDNPQAAWKAFKQDHNRWNLLYTLAAPVPTTLKEAEIGKYDAADLADSAEEYKQIKEEQELIRREVNKRTERVLIEPRPDAEGLAWLKIGTNTYINFKANKEDWQKLKKELDEKKLTAEELANAYNATDRKIALPGGTLTDIPPGEWAKFEKDLRESKRTGDIRQEIRDGKRPNPEITKKALDLIEKEDTVFKPAGQLRTWPWFEYRGPNPFLLVTGNAGNVRSITAEAPRSVPWERGQFLGWLMTDQAPVLLEPLIKFLRPVLYLLHPAAGGWNRLYLFLVVLWTLAVWAMFGAAITRMAAVQVARNNEKIGMTEALRFAWARYQSYFSAPLFPLIFLALLTVFLFLFGLLEVFTWVFGDIVVAGLFFPLALIVGLIMAVVLVGLVGWPLMYATISTEGSDSFDAISRSYSYVYQAPWQYLWYTLVALAYGAVLVFFVGLMGSLVVYLTKWGINQVPAPESREPSYLFAYAPTSFGWRDLLLYQSPNAATVDVVRSNGTVAQAVELSPSYAAQMTWNNTIGAFLVSVWLYLLFLLVLGFGYSYFWTASTIIYLLMRRKVDDTELDEIHLEEDEMEEPYAPPAPAAATTAVKSTGPAGLTMVEPPSLRTPPAPVTPPTTTLPVAEPPRTPAEATEPGSKLSEPVSLPRSDVPATNKGGTTPARGNGETEEDEPGTPPDKGTL